MKFGLTLTNGLDTDQVTLALTNCKIKVKKTSEFDKGLRQLAVPYHAYDVRT